MDLTFKSNEIDAKAQELFENEILNEGLLTKFCRGHIGDNDLLDKLKHFREIASENAVDEINKELRDGREESEAEMYSDEHELLETTG